MTAARGSIGREYTCPECPGDVSFDGGSWVCSGCGYTPAHGAD